MATNDESVNTDGVSWEKSIVKGKSRTSLSFPFFLQCPIRRTAELYVIVIIKGINESVIINGLMLVW